MKKALLGGVAALAISAGAIAPASAQGPWHGFYIGGHVGYGEAFYDGVFNNGAGAPVNQSFNDLDIDGIAGGIHGGFNYQFGGGGGMDFVAGIEGDVMFTDWRDAEFFGPPTTAAGSEQGIIGDVDILATIRGRLGVAMDQWLFYITGGIAFADADAGLFYSGTTVDIDFDDVGGVIGGGVEWAFSETFSFRGEVLYYIFDDSQNTSTAQPISDAGDFVEFEDAYVVRAGVSIKLDQLFGGGS